MKVLIVGGDDKTADRWNNCDVVEQMLKMYGTGVEVVFVTKEECEQIKGDEYNLAIFNEMLNADLNPIYKEESLKSKKPVNKPYYRAKERW